MDYVSGWCKSKRRLDGFTAIVTGSNTGMGKEIALDFYKRGARVIMACRNIQKAKEAKNNIEDVSHKEQGTGQLIIEELDLCSLKSVKDLASRVTSREASVNILVCNAGVMMCPEGQTEEGFETHMGTNHLAHALLTLLLLPLMVKSAPSRVVIVSSHMHYFYKLDTDNINCEKKSYSPLRAYSVSKVANVLFAKALAQKLKEHNIDGVTVYSVHPGIVKTDIARHFENAAWSIVTYCFHSPLLQWFYKTPLCGAQTAIYCAVDEKCANESGYYYSECGKTWTSFQCSKLLEIEKLWRVTIEMLKLQNYDPFTQHT